MTQNTFAPPAAVDIDTLAALLHRLDCIRCRMTWCCGGISTDDQDRARDVAQWPEFGALFVEHTPSTAVRCPDCRTLHDPEPCRREAADCDCCSAILAATAGSES